MSFEQTQRVFCFSVGCILTQICFTDLPCCYKIQDQRCRDTCERTLSTMTDQYKIAGELEKICGPILPQVTAKPSQ